MVYSKKGKKQYRQRFCLWFNRQTESLIDLNDNVPAVRLTVYKKLNWSGIILNFPTAARETTREDMTLWSIEHSDHFRFS